MLKVSKCMRQHGISGFPNPTLSIPSNSNPARAIARAGVILAIPSSINLRSPTFKHAAAVCGFPPDDWYPVQGGGAFAGTGHRYTSLAASISRTTLDIEAEARDCRFIRKG